MPPPNHSRQMHVTSDSPSPSKHSQIVSSKSSSAIAFPSPSMSSKNLPPATPTRSLLKRIHRRSSLLPPPPPDAASSSAASSTSSHSRRISLQLERRKDVQEEEQPMIVPEEDEEKEVWNEVEDLLDTVQRQNEIILDLEKRNKDLERELQSEKSKKSDKGLTKLSAIKVEREFLSQEMILKGLQRDNEDKTVEVENLRRRLKSLSEFLAKQYGEGDWHSVVAGGANLPQGAGVAAPASPEKEFNSTFTRPSALAKVLSGNASPVARARTVLPPTLGQESLRSGNPFTSDFASSPSKHNLAQFGAAPNNDDVVIPTLARMQTPLTSPSKQTFGSAATDGYFAPLGDAPQPDFDPQTLLVSIEGVRLLLQGFERRNAMRRTELEEMIDRATLAEERAKKLKQSPAVPA